MPIPTQPRRAGPPRRRAPKSPGDAASESQTDLISAAETAREDPTPVNALERDEVKGEAEGGHTAAHEKEEEQGEETEEEAAARRKRIADRIAKSGGLNFLSGQRPEEVEVEAETEAEPKAESGYEQVCSGYWPYHNGFWLQELCHKSDKNAQRRLAMAPNMPIYRF
jgi:hypothetical protein